MAKGQVFNSIGAALDRLSDQERKRLGIAVAVFGTLLVLGVTWWVSSRMDDLREQNGLMREALRTIDKYRDKFVAAQSKAKALEMRITEQQLELNSYVEKVASSVGVSIDESDAIKPISGRKYSQRGLQIKLLKINVGQMVQMIEELEKAPKNLVQITELSVAPRWKSNGELDVQMVVSTYDRVKSKPKSKKGKTGGRG